jgi:uncharacterized protein YndB with AHSA1/START domain
VPSPPGPVYRALADPSSYGMWWPGIRVVGEGTAVRLRLDRGAPAAAVPEGTRPDLGLFVRLGPPYRGTMEWFLEPFQDGTVVNCILDLDLAGGWPGASRRLRRIRAAIRRGLVGLIETTS